MLISHSVTREQNFELTKSRGSGRNLNGNTRETHLHHEPALKNYSKACNSFRSADLPPPSLEDILAVYPAQIQNNSYCAPTM